MCRFFTLDSTAEILATMMPLISPLDKKSLSSHLSELCLFLPTLPYHARNGQGYHLWMNDLLMLWDSCNNSTSVNNVGTFPCNIREGECICNFTNMIFFKGLLKNVLFTCFISNYLFLLCIVVEFDGADGKAC